jgi:hypothetical protein
MSWEESHSKKGYVMLVAAHGETHRMALVALQSLPLCLVSCVLPLTSSVADILTLKNGRKCEGIVTPVPDNPDVIRVQQLSGTFTIARDSIDTIPA